MKSLLFQLSITLYLLCAYAFSSQAQSNLNDDGGTYTVSATGTYQDFKVPSNTTQTFITFTLTGADGGSGIPGNCDKVPGGAGAEITAVFRIGNEVGQIPKGATIRFIPGEGGLTVTSGTGSLKYAAAAGGGGTGLLIRKGSNWDILAVAGGGGGAFVGLNSFGVCRKDPGNSAQTGPNGGQGDNDGAGTPGTGGNGAISSESGHANGGGGAFSDAESSNGTTYTTSGQKGMETGSTPDVGDGGYGFGSGGSADIFDYRGGGGGGYSGGADGGEKGSGGGGGSFVSPDVVGFRKTVPERTKEVHDGKIEYQFYSACQVQVNQVSGSLTYACRDIEGSGSVSVSTGATLITDASITGECDQAIVVYYLYEFVGPFPALRSFNTTGEFENVPPGNWRIEARVVGGALPSSDTYDIEVLEEDPTPTSAKCVDAVTVDLGSNGRGTITLDDVDNGSTGQCGIQSLGLANSALSSTTFPTRNYTCNSVGLNKIYLRVTDNFGNTDVCETNVYVQDNVAPSWTGSGNVKATVSLDENGEASVSQDDILDISKFVDDCFSTDQLSFIFSGNNAFTCTDLGENPSALDLEVSDLSGNSSNYTLDVTVIENNAVVAHCQDITVQLDANGEATVSTADIDKGSSDGCNIPDLSLDITSFDCENVGDNTVVLTATNSSGDSDDCHALVLVLDNIAPAPSCQNITVQLDDNGQAQITAADIDSGSNDACGIDHLALNKNVFDCEDLGIVDVLLTATDYQGNESSCTAQITVVDDIAPVIAQCPDLTLDLRGGVATFAPNTSQYFQQASDNCEITSFAFLGSTLMTCEDIGVNERAVEVIDASGNRTVCTFNVTVKDEESPTASCKDVTISLDETGNGAITTAQINDGSSDDCSDISLALDQSQFDCSDIGSNNIVVLTVTDDYGNTSSCTSNVSVEDNVAPIALCLGGLTPDQSQLNSNGAGHQGFSILGQSFTAGLTGDLGKIRILLGSTVQEGTIAPTIEIREGGGLDGTLISSVEAIPMSPDQSTPYQWIEVTFSNPAQVTAGNKYTFVMTGNRSGGNMFETIMLAMRMHGNPYSGGKMFFPTSVLENFDILFETFVTSGDYFQLELDDTGLGILTVDQIVAESTDACGIASLELDKTQFSCDELGDNTVTLTATDLHNNSSSCQATVKVVDQMGPTLDCDGYEVALNGNGSAEISATDLLDEPFDACGIASYAVSQTSFSCQDLGTQQVTVTVTDNNGNISTCKASVKVRDNRKPTASCQDVTIQLGVDGTATLSPQQINDGSSDNCSIGDLFLSKDEFDCSDIGQNTVTLEVEDKDDNTSFCQATVTVEDNTAPIANCQDLTINLDENGLSGIVVEQVGPGSYDNCSGFQLALGSLSKTQFTCEDLGTNIVTMTISDAAGNTSSCEAIITVLDKITPILTCQQEMTVNTDSGECGAYVTLPEAQASDNCGLKSFQSRYRPIDDDEDPIGDFSAWADDHSGFFEAGSYEIQWEAGDESNNYSYCVLILDVIDQEAPEVVCQDITVQVDENGQASLSATAINNGSNDACGLANLSLDIASFDCSNLGDNIVTLTATDLKANSSSCQATVTVVDDINPTLTCPTDMAVNTDQGECGAYVTLPKAAPADNCSIQGLQSRYRTLDEAGNPVGSWSAWEGDHSGFFELGAYEIQWRTKDASGNKEFCTFRLDIIDEEAPEVACTDITIHFNGEETIAIASAVIFDAAASFDACGAVVVSGQSINEISCESVGEVVPVQVVGMDPNGNTNTCTAQVTVVGMPCGFEATDIDCPDGAEATYDSAAESFTLTANDCEGYPDGEFSTVMTELCGDGEIIAKVASLIGDGRAGVIMMESDDPGARFVSKIRQGNKFKTYTSTNGSYWRLSHTINFSNFADCIQVGMLVYSKNANEPVTAVFENVKVNGDSPSALEQADGIPADALQGINEQDIKTDPSIGIDLDVAPNPFADQTQIKFTLPKSSDVTLEIYNLHGQRVHSLENARLDVGTHRYQWNGQSSKGEVLPTGIYMLRLRADKKWITTKVSLVNR